MSCPPDPSFFLPAAAGMQPIWQPHPCLSARISPCRWASKGSRALSFPPAQPGLPLLGRFVAL